jgi:O-antigen ligase
VLLTVCRRELLAACRRHPVLTAAAAGFCLWLLATALVNGATAFVAGVKVVEYSVIGAGVITLVDDDERFGRVLDLLLAVTIVADVVGLYDYAVHGAGRVDSFLGTHDFAALATLPLLTVLAGFFAPHRWSRRTQAIAGLAGWLGLTLTAALASLLGLYLGVVVLAVLAWRAKRLAVGPAAATLAVVVAVSVPTLFLRHNDLGFLHKLSGKEEKHHAEFASSWSQRLIYLYVGGRIWQAHPIAGTGWYGLLPPREFARFVPAARRAFPDNPARYFPPVDRPYIPQQAFDQVLFELGLVGEALFLLLLGAAAAIAWRRARAARPARELEWVPLLFLGGMVGALAGAGLFGGIPVVALMWLTLALPAAGRGA